MTELLIVMAISGIMILVSIPALSRLQSRNAVRAAASEVRGVFDQTRRLAMARNQNVALKFLQRSGEWLYAIYRDGDGDGVRNDDIVSGIDPLVRPPVAVLSGTRMARIGLPATPARDPDSGRLMPITASPIRFNVSRLCSFSREGEATSGSVFVTDGKDAAALVRVLGATGRIRVLVYDRASGNWK